MPKPRPPRTTASITLLWLLLALTSTIGCENPQNRASSPSSSSNTGTEEADEPSDQSSDEGPESSSRFRRERRAMVRDQIAARDVDDEAVLEAMRSVPRHEFVPEGYRARAYADTPLPIGHDQTISQPYIVAFMTQALQVDDSHDVLEIGTGSGYQAAILSKLAGSVYSIEIVCDLAERARSRLDRLGYDNVTVKCGDGYKGWPKHAPFDRVIVTAAPPEIPEALVEQLAPGGRMVLPVGENIQELKVVEKKEDGTTETIEMMDVRFVPMVRGDAG